MKPQHLLLPPAPIVKYTITLSAGEGGTVSTTGGEYEAGQTVSVTATPQGEYVFTSWSDGNTNATRTITIGSNSTLTANFEKRKYPLTINFEGEGEVIEEIVNAGRTTEYDSGTTVKLTAQAAAEWVFIGWTGDIESTEESVQIVIGEPKEVTATFEKKKYPLTVNIEGEGEVLEEIVNAGRTTDYDSGTTVKLTAQPEDEWLFTGWSGDIGDIDPTENPIQLTIIESKTVTANFEKRKYPLTINFEGEGEVLEEIVNAGRTTEYDSGTTVKLTAQPEDEWLFTGWSGDIGEVDPTENPIQLNIIESKTVTATFEKKKYPLTVNIEGEGEVLEEIIDAGRTTDYDSGTTVKLTAVPAENGWEFVGWTGAIESEELEVQLLVSEAKEITATFISIDQDGDGVNDNIDECPDTPQGLPVDEKGCITVQNINLNYNTLKMFPGKTIQMIAEVSPSNVLDDSISWSVEDNTIATVDENGLVTTITEGETNIVVSSNDGGSTKLIPILVGDWTDMISFNQLLIDVIIFGSNYTGIFGSRIINNSTQETIDLKGLKVYNGTGVFLYLDLDETSSPDLFPNLAPGQNQGLTVYFSVFVDVPIFEWTFSHNGEDVTVVHKYGFEGNVVFGKGERSSRNAVLNKTDLSGDISQSN